MKKILVFFFILGIPVILFSQKIESPKTGLTTASYVTIKSIEINDTATIIDFHTKYRPGYWIQIPEDTFIKSPDDTVKLYIISTAGIPLGDKFTMPPSGETEYTLIFPSVDPSVARIDYGEDQGSWQIYDIQIKNDRAASLIPEELYGNWFGTGANWELSLFDTVALYDMQIWKYANADIKRKKGAITLANHREERTIYYKKGRRGNVFFGESPESLSEFTHTVDFASASRVTDDPAFTEPVFRIDTAVITGFIKGYTPRVGVRTGMIHVNDIILGEQKNIILNINEDGSFRTEVPIYYPHGIFIRSELFSGEVFIEPGEELFILYDPFLGRDIPQYGHNPFLFMGKNAEVNRWLSEARGFIRRDFSELNKKILDITFEEYKARLLDDLQQALADLEKIKSTRGISPKAFQVLKTDIVYTFYTEILGYEMYVQSAHRQKTRQQVSGAGAIPGITLPGVEYYSFLDDDLVNNPLAVISNQYYFFINRLKFLDILNERYRRVYGTQILEGMREEGYRLTPDEEILDSMMRLVETAEYIEADREVIKLMPLSARFFDDHRDQYKEMMEGRVTGMMPGDIVIKLAEKLGEEGISLSEEEKELVEAFKAYNAKEAVKNYRDRMQEEPLKSKLPRFHAERSGIINSINQDIRSMTFQNNLGEIFGISMGFATDIMFAQDQCRRIVSEYTPASDYDMGRIQNKILTPFIREYVAVSNEAVRKLIEFNKIKVGYTVHDVPESEPEDLFTNIMKKYRGKVVFIDFWATWCGPCRSGIQRIKPLKDELEGRDIAFVYITGPSSPRNTWENMITDIKGDHYYLSGDEWNNVSALFNISGIPHYVMVNKAGEVVNPRLPYMQNQALKNLLLEHLDD
jgi:thiol-disulfide isomerase/thioredoxin